MSTDIETRKTGSWEDFSGPSHGGFSENLDGRLSGPTPPDRRGVLREKSGMRVHTHRPCLHALAGRVTTRRCTRDYHCDSCEFDDLVAKSSLVYPRESNAFTDIDGHRYSEHCHYHPGHAWVYGECGGNVRIGLDDFASSLVGYADAVQMPPPGARIFPGRPAFALKRNRHWVKVLSPIQGTIQAVNSRVLHNPELVRTSAFEDGWLVLAKPDSISDHCVSLLHGKAAREWLEQECGFFRMLLPGGLGGRQGDGFPRAPGQRTLISEWAWITLVETFLHTQVLLEPDRLIL